MFGCTGLCMAVLGYIGPFFLGLCMFMLRYAKCTLSVRCYEITMRFTPRTYQKRRYKTRCKVATKV